MDRAERGQPDQVAAQLAPRLPQMTPRRALEEVLWQTPLHPLRYVIARDERESQWLWAETRDLAVTRLWRIGHSYDLDAVREVAVMQLLTAADAVMSAELQQMLARSPYPVELLLSLMGEEYRADYDDDRDAIFHPDPFDVDSHRGQRGDPVTGARPANDANVGMFRLSYETPQQP